MKAPAGQTTKVYEIAPDYPECAICMPEGAEYFGIVNAPQDILVQIIPGGAFPGDLGQPTGVDIDEGEAILVEEGDSLVNRPISANDVVKVGSADYAEETPTVLGALQLELEYTNVARNNVPPEKLLVWPNPDVFAIVDTELPAIVDGVEFSHALEIRGGVGPLAFSIADDYGDNELPSGLSIDPETGVISGTPDTPGDYDFKVLCEDSRGTPVECERIFEGTVLEAAPEIITESLEDGVMGESYADTIETSGGEGDVAITLRDGGRGDAEGGLPAGMLFDDNEDGTADIETDGEGEDAIADFGEFPISADVTDEVGRTHNKNLLLTVHGINSTLAAGQVGVAYDDDIEIAEGITEPVLALLDTGDALPDGLTFVDNGDGTATIAGTPAAATDDTYDLHVRLTGRVNGKLRTVVTPMELVIAPA